MKSEIIKHEHNDNCICSNCSNIWNNEFMKAVDRGEYKLKNKYIKWLKQISDLYKEERSIFIKWLSQKNNRFCYSYMEDYFKYIYSKYIKLPYPEKLNYNTALNLTMVHKSAMYIYSRIKNHNERVGFFHIITELPLSKIRKYEREINGK